VCAEAGDVEARRDCNGHVARAQGLAGGELDEEAPGVPAVGGSEIWAFTCGPNGARILRWAPLESAASPPHEKFTGPA
jgi:hypothetical protein